MKEYDLRFYKKRHQKTVYSAETILSIILGILPEIKSAVDVGCGVGTWLSVLKTRGIVDILGIDGDWVSKELLQIPRQCFFTHDVSTEINLQKRYDLAISLEVGEHLSHDNAIIYVRSLARLSDFVLFSAAIPYQGGRKHINEQWPEYWVNLFGEHDYQCVDVLRKTIWYDENIPSYYRQNIFLFVKKEKASLLRLNGFVEQSFPLSLVHPDLYISKISKTVTMKGTWRLFWRAFEKRLKQIMRESIKR
jgi:hypothetical protein